MAYVQNAAVLTAHGDVELRRIALGIIEHALAATDSYPLAKKQLEFDGRILRIGGEQLEMNGAARVHFLGAGKASFGIARAVEEALGDALSSGLVICKHGQEGTLERIKVRLASHPIPDEAGMQAADEALALARAVRPDDILICGFTGGSSSLMPLPVAGLTLEDKQEMTRLLLSCGANIVEINVVRKHLSRIKGGQLAAATPADVTLINLTVSDVIGNALDYITDPGVADSSTLADARATLDKYALWDKAPPAVASYLKEGGRAFETPKDLAPRRVRNIVLTDGMCLCTAAAEKARSDGFQPLILSTALEGESREVGGVFAAVAREVVASGHPLKPPCAIIGGGETVVNLDSWRAEGGPNQEFALSAALLLDGVARAVVVGLDSDGTDGPTNYAGGMVDDQSAACARAIGLNLSELLRSHQSTEALVSLGDVILTGATGTNVNDLKLLLVAGP